MSRSPGHLIQVMLPLQTNDGGLQPPSLFKRTEEELTAQFQGLTAYTRNPAKGIWKNGGTEIKEDVIVYEVLAVDVDVHWWKQYRERLEQRFNQDSVHIRALPANVL